MALQTNGSTGEISHGNIAAMNGVAQWTFMYWLYLPPALVQGRVPWGKLSGGVGTLSQGGATTADLTFWFSGAITPWNPAGVVASTWMHYAYVFDGSQATNALRAKMYKDGVLLTQTSSAGVPTTIPNSAAVSFFVGSSGGSFHIAGIFAHCKMWLAALTLAEVQNEMQTARPQRTANLIMQAPYDDSVTVPKDYSGAANHGTVGGGATFVAGPPVIHGG